MLREKHKVVKGGMKCQGWRLKFQRRPKKKKKQTNMKNVKKSVMWLEGACKGHSRWRNDKCKGLGWEGA